MAPFLETQVWTAKVYAVLPCFWNIPGHTAGSTRCPFSLDCTVFPATELQPPATWPAFLLVWGDQEIRCGGVGERTGNKYRGKGG